MDFRTVHARMRLGGLILGCLALAALSLLLAAPAPGYDAWSWIVWGREVAHGTLSTAEGPAFKPLPVAVTAVLSPLGDDAAPVAWVILARAAALAAVAAAFVVARRLGGTVAGVLAAVGVALCGASATYAASGDVTGLFVALVLAGLLAWRDGRTGLVPAAAIACCLLRVEAWPFALALGVVLWRSDRALRPWLAGAALLVPVAWFVPEWLGSGDLLRSSDRARVPNPGQPAEADVPVLASLDEAIELPLWPLLAAAAGIAAGVLVAARDRDAPHVAVGRTAAARAAALLAAVGAAWVLLVALMAEVGFSGEARYALPGAALITVAGAVAIAGLPRAFVIVGALLVAVAAVPRVIDLADVRADQRHKWALARDLDRVVAKVGRDAILRCGTPYVGPYRGPLLAYALEVAKEDVEPDATPRPPGVVFRSRLLRDAPVTPAADGFGPLDGVGAWDLHARCG